MALYNASLSGGGSGGSAIACPLGKVVADVFFTENILPYNFKNGGAVVLNNELHLLGGSDGNTSHYKWNGSSWESVSTLPYSFYFGGAVVLNNEIHLLGGSSNKKAQMEWFNLV